MTSYRSLFLISVIIFLIELLKWIGCLVDSPVKAYW